MSQTPRKTEHALPRWAIAAGILAIGLLMAAVVLALAMWKGGQSDMWLHGSIALLAIAAALGVALIIVLLHSLDSLRKSIAQLESGLHQLADVEPQQIVHPTPQQTAPAPAASAMPTPEIIQLLEDIRENSLLSESQRQEKRRRLIDEEFASAEQLFNQLPTGGDINQTRLTIESLTKKYPDDPRVRSLSSRYEEADEELESQDVHDITRQINDLIIISAWQKARELAADLQKRHPNSLQARQLVLHIEREHQLFSDEQRRRMAAEVQRFASRKRWEGALAAARTFVERFPDSPEAEPLRLQIPTLEANAQIEHRQQLETQIMDFARHGRYIEAAQLARSVIEQYPDSPQADALRSQLSRLEELANNPDAPPARVRVD